MEKLDTRTRKDLLDRAGIVRELKDMIKVGEHITLDILGVMPDYSPAFLKEIVYKIAETAEVKILDIAQHEFKPHGFTMIALLAKSHMSLHTFPDKNVISFDFFTCGNISPSVAVDIFEKEIEHERIVVKQFERSSMSLSSVFLMSPASLYEDVYNTPGQKKYYVVNEVIDTFVSKKDQFIEILDLEEFGRALFIDNEIQVAENDEHLYSSTMVSLATTLNLNNSSAAIIGGGDGGVARECLYKGFDSIDWFELDSEVVEACKKHFTKIGNIPPSAQVAFLYHRSVNTHVTESNLINCIWGDAFESIKSIEDSKYDKIFIDLLQDQTCIDLIIRNMKNLKRILKLDGVITVQVGSQDYEPEQVNKWLDVLSETFGNVKSENVFIPSFGCNWNFASSILK